MPYRPHEFKSCYTLYCSKCISLMADQANEEIISNALYLIEQREEDDLQDDLE